MISPPYRRGERRLSSHPFMRLDRAALLQVAAQVSARAREVARHPARRWRAISRSSGSRSSSRALSSCYAPYFTDLSLHGIRDWDEDENFRYITVLSLTRYHELPWWHPFSCGGFPSWAHAEGANNLVSPYLPLYLAFPSRSPCAWKWFWPRSRLSSSRTCSPGASPRARRCAPSSRSPTRSTGAGCCKSPKGTCGTCSTPGSPSCSCSSICRWSEGSSAARSTRGSSSRRSRTWGDLILCRMRRWRWSCTPASSASHSARCVPSFPSRLQGFSGIGLAAPKLLPVADLMKSSRERSIRRRLSGSDSCSIRSPIRPERCSATTLRGACRCGAGTSTGST